MGLHDHVLDSAALPQGFSTFCDFIRQDDASDGGDVDFTTVASGTNNGTIAIQAANGGVARISAVATVDATGGQVQGPGVHVVTANKNILFKCKFVLNETTSTNVATESQQYFGFFPVDTSIDASLPDDGIYFKKADGATTIQCVTRQGGTNQAATTLAAATFTMDKSDHRYGITVQPNSDGTGNVEFNIDGKTVCRHPGVTLPASTVVLSKSFSFRAGDATGTKWADLDYIGGFQAR